jgi:hypothetical protein
MPSGSDNVVNVGVRVDLGNLNAGMDAAAAKVASTSAQIAAALKAGGATADEAAILMKGMGITGANAAAAVAVAFGSEATPAIKGTSAAVKGLNLDFAATQLFARDLGVSIPFGAARAISSIGGIGTALSAAFAPILAIALIEQLGKAVGAVTEFAFHTKEAETAWKETDKAIAADTREIETLNRQLTETVREESEVGKSASEVARLRAIFAESDVHDAETGVALAQQRLSTEQKQLNTLIIQHATAQAIQSTTGVPSVLTGPKTGDIEAQRAAVAKANDELEVAQTRWREIGEESKLAGLESGQAAKDASEQAAKKAEETQAKQIRALDELNAKNLEGRNVMIEQSEAAAKAQESIEADKAKIANEQDEFIFSANLDLQKEVQKSQEAEERQVEEGYKKQTDAFIRESKRREKVAEEEAKKEEETERRALNAIDQALNQNLARWITGQERWRRAEYEIWNGIADTAIKSLLKVAEQELVGLLLHKSIAKEGVLVDAKKAASGAYAAVSDIPVIGPFLAPEAAAAAFAAVLALGSFALGGVVPKDMPAIVHEGEGVFTPQQTKNIQQIAEGGGTGGGVNIHMGNVSALDSRGVGRVLDRNTREIQRTLMRLARRGNAVNRGWMRH